MSFWTAVVVIAVIVALFRLRGERVRGPDPLDAPSRDELARQVAELQDRIAVLERIATEEHRSRAIADEIETLRQP